MKSECVVVFVYSSLAICFISISQQYCDLKRMLEFNDASKWKRNGFHSDWSKWIDECLSDLHIFYKISRLWMFFFLLLLNIDSSTFSRMEKPSTVEKMMKCVMIRLALILVHNLSNFLSALVSIESKQRNMDWLFQVSLSLTLSLPRFYVGIFISTPKNGIFMAWNKWKFISLDLNSSMSDFLSLKRLFLCFFWSLWFEMKSITNSNVVRIMGDDDLFALWFGLAFQNWSFFDQRILHTHRLVGRERERSKNVVKIIIEWGMRIVEDES